MIGLTLVFSEFLCSTRDLSTLPSLSFGSIVLLLTSGVFYSISLFSRVGFSTFIFEFSMSRWSFLLSRVSFSRFFEASSCAFGFFMELGCFLWVSSFTQDFPSSSLDITVLPSDGFFSTGAFYFGFGFSSTSFLFASTFLRFLDTRSCLFHSSTGLSCFNFARYDVFSPFSAFLDVSSWYNLLYGVYSEQDFSTSEMSGLLLVSATETFFFSSSEVIFSDSFHFFSVSTLSFFYVSRDASEYGVGYSVSVAMESILSMWELVFSLVSTGLSSSKVSATAIFSLVDSRAFFFSSDFSTSSIFDLS